MAVDPAPPRLAELAPEAVLRRLELTVLRRLDGLLQGDHLGLVPGPGSEPADAREYQPGDDVRRMDWNVTARVGLPHVRDLVADRELETWVVADASPSLAFGTARCEKRDLVLAAVAATGFLTLRAGNRLGAVVVGHADAELRAEPKGGRDALLALLLRLARASEPSGAVRRGEVAAPAPTDLAAAIERLNRPPRRRGLCVVASDWLSSTEWQRPLRRLSERHQVLCVEVVDPRELELPDVGLLTVVDTETGELRELPTHKRQWRERYATAAAEQRAAIASDIRRAGADHLVLRTDRDWVLDLVRHVLRRRAQRHVRPRPATGAT